MFKMDKNLQIIFILRWGFTPLEEAKRFQHDLVFRYLAKYVEDNYPKELEKMLKEQEQKNKATNDGQKDCAGK